MVVVYAWLVSSSFFNPSDNELVAYLAVRRFAIALNDVFHIPNGVAYLDMAMSSHMFATPFLIVDWLALKTVSFGRMQSFALSLM
jgi:hypothetical protein